MARLRLSGVLALIVCAAVLATGGGCVLGTRTERTQVVVTVPGDRMLFMAVIPRLLPDGTSAAEEKEALLEAVAEKAGGYTLDNGQLFGWVPAPDKEMITEDSDVVWVAGKPEVGQLLYESLRDDFDQPRPLVLPIPLQILTMPLETELPATEQVDMPAGG
jgi:hypothetical protein